MTAKKLTNTPTTVVALRLVRPLVGQLAASPIVPRFGLLIPVVRPPEPWSLNDWYDHFWDRFALRVGEVGIFRQLEAVRKADVDMIATWLARHRPLPKAEAAWTGSREEFHHARIEDARWALGNIFAERS